MTTYNFDEQMQTGDQGEKIMDDFFAARGYTIRPATPEEQRRGIDRAFRSPKTGRVSLVEYKSDHTAARTGNAFIETVSVDSAGKPGWALTSQADYLVYFIPPTGTIYVIPFLAINWELPRWIRDYPPREAQNDGYKTHGVIIPLTELERQALRIYNAGDIATGSTHDEIPDPKR